MIGYVFWTSGFLGCAKPTSIVDSQWSSEDQMNNVYPELRAHFERWLSEGPPQTLTPDRQEEFQALAEWTADNAHRKMTFVCTHNSRRSHMSQLWAQAAAYFFEIPEVTTYSGGTETTAFNPRAIAALRTHGFVIEATDTVFAENNIVYHTRINDRMTPIKSYSKVYSDGYNPAQEFAAVMVCSSADRGCPLVYGSDIRIAVPYIDPKRSDGTPEETATYLAKSEEIGREMAYLMSLVAEVQRRNDSEE